MVVASAGNDGLGGNVKETYPASFDGVLAVASSDRNNERAPFSQSGEFVGVAAPGGRHVSQPCPAAGTVPTTGRVSLPRTLLAVAALIKAEHQDWTPGSRSSRRSSRPLNAPSPGHDRLVGWGVVDPLRALTEDEKPIEEPTPDEGISQAEAPTPAKFQLGETTQERNERIGTYAVVGGGVLVIVIAGGAQIYRDWRRRTGRVMGWKRCFRLTPDIITESSQLAAEAGQFARLGDGFGCGNLVSKLCRRQADSLLLQTAT